MAGRFSPDTWRRTEENPRAFSRGKDGAEKPKPSLSAKRLFGKELIQIDRGAVSGEKAGYMRARGHSFCSLKGNGKLV